MRYQATDKSGQVWQYNELPIQNYASNIWIPLTYDLSRHSTIKVSDSDQVCENWINSLIDLSIQLRGNNMKQSDIVDILHQFQDELTTADEYEKQVEILIEKIEADLAKEEIG